MAGAVHIGTSGWHYKHWCGPFYPDKFSGSKMLEFYYRHFDTVEINNSFYRLPDASTFECWRDATPPQFCFAVKASRFITHMKKLSDPENALANFMPRAEKLGAKLGPILFQLPPKWKLNLQRLEEFLAALPRKHLYTFEFREPSWLTEPVYERLRRFNAAFCVYELAGFHAPRKITTDWTYVRLHGPDGKYQGSYSRKRLEEWADWMAEQRTKLRAIYVYFDNDQAAYAAQNALELKRLVMTREGKLAA